MSSRQNGMDAVNDSERTAATITPAQKWVNAGPDEGALHALLDRIAEHIPREQIDVLWIFPTRIAGGVESTVIVIAGFDADTERRTVATAHFRVTRDRRGRASVALQMQEHGTAPIGATQRVVDGVLRRLGDEVGREAPRRVEITGSGPAWWELYAEVGGEVPEDALAGQQEAELEAQQHSVQQQFTEDDEASTPPHGDVLEPADEAADATDEEHPR